MPGKRSYIVTLVPRLHDTSLLLQPWVLLLLEKEPVLISRTFTDLEEGVAEREVTLLLQPVTWLHSLISVRLH